MSATLHDLRAELAAQAVQAVVMGGSAGALDGLLRVLPALPLDLAVPVLVVVHVPSRSAVAASEVFAERSALVVREAVDKEEARAGLVLFAPADYHLLVERDGRVALSMDAPEHFSRPAIDVLFETASRAWGAHLLGVVFSGASEDGAAGLAAICRAGGLAWVESPLVAASPIMPAAALREALGARALTVPEMVGALTALPRRGASVAGTGAAS